MFLILLMFLVGLTASPCHLAALPLPVRESRADSSGSNELDNTGNLIPKARNDVFYSRPSHQQPRLGNEASPPSFVKVLPTVQQLTDAVDEQNTTRFGRLNSLNSENAVPISSIKQGTNMSPSSAASQTTQAYDSDPSIQMKTYSNPFSVNIEGEKFYGGLITYSHELHPARVCRVLNACLKPDYTLVLPQWMRRHDELLNFHCGQTKLEFTLPDTQPPPSLERLDLVGTSVPRPSMPDFVRDFMPNAVIFDLIYGDHQVSKTCHSRRGQDCTSFPGLVEGLRPTVLLPTRLKSVNRKESWVHQYIKLMKPPRAGRQPKIVYEDVFRETNDEMTCYRSVLFTRGPFNGNAIMPDHLRNIHFLQRNGIEKASRKVHNAMAFSATKEGPCSINVTITNRRLVDGAHNRLIGRYITNIPSVRDAIVKQANRIPGLYIRVSTMALEGKSLRWQINGMKKTDIWVAGHGSLLTNMLFLRENSSVIEIQPFAYYPQTYKRMASGVAHVNYERYIAHPDVEAFRTCMRQMYPDEHSMKDEAEKLLRLYELAASKYFRADSTHSLVLHSWKNTDLVHVKTCAGMQRFSTNARNLAILIVRHARLRCGLPKPLTARDGMQQPLPPRQEPLLETDARVQSRNALAN